MSVQDCQSNSILADSEMTKSPTEPSTSPPAMQEQEDIRAMPLFLALDGLLHHRDFEQIERIFSVMLSQPDVFSPLDFLTALNTTAAESDKLDHWKELLSQANHRFAKEGMNSKAELSHLQNHLI